MADNTLTLKSKDGTQATFTITESTKVRRGREKVSASDLQANTPVMVKHKDGVALMVMAKPPKGSGLKKNRKGAQEGGDEAPPPDTGAP